MTSDRESPVSPDDAPPCFVDVGVYASLAAAAERGLVVLAMGLGYWVFEREDGFHVGVEPCEAAAVREQLARYEAESAHWPPRPPAAVVRHEPTLPATAVVAVVLVVTFIAQASTDGRLGETGLLDARAVWGGGQWWRIITALTLHADLGHLLGNIAGAAFFGHFVVRRFGAGLGWLAIVVAGALGNLATAWFFRDPGHLSLGASTAVFGALGLLAGSGVRCPAIDAGPAGKIRRALLPLAAAIVLLGWLGSGGPETDVFAHAAGFCAAIGLGWMLGGPWLAREVPQQACALVTVALPAVSWALALLAAR